MSYIGPIAGRMSGRDLKMSEEEDCKLGFYAIRMKFVGF